MEPIIKVDNVSMCFNLSTESTEPEGIPPCHGAGTLAVRRVLRPQGREPRHGMPGDFYGLVGLNGSGKSTLLKTIAGVYKPSKGKK